MAKEYYCAKCKKNYTEVRWEARKGVMKAICPRCSKILGSEAAGTSTRQWS